MSIVGFGFTKQEALDLLRKAFISAPTSDMSVLIKNTLLEIKNHG